MELLMVMVSLFIISATCGLVSADEFEKQYGGVASDLADMHLECLYTAFDSADSQGMTKNKIIKYADKRCQEE